MSPRKSQPASRWPLCGRPLF